MSAWGQAYWVACEDVARYMHRQAQAVGALDCVDVAGEALVGFHAMVSAGEDLMDSTDVDPHTHEEQR